MQETYRDSGSIPGLGRSPAEGNGYPLQHSCLENPTHRGTWCATVHGVTKSGAWQYGLYILHSSKSNYSFTSTNYCWLAHIYKQTHTHTHTQPQDSDESPSVRTRLKHCEAQIGNFWHPDSHEGNNQEMDSRCVIITATRLQNYHPTTLVSLS